MKEDETDIVLRYHAGKDRPLERLRRKRSPAGTRRPDDILTVRNVRPEVKWALSYYASQLRIPVGDFLSKVVIEFCDKANAAAGLPLASKHFQQVKRHTDARLAEARTRLAERRARHQAAARVSS